jgi:Domain of unknown function (DUF4272)
VDFADLRAESLRRLERLGLTGRLPLPLLGDDDVASLRPAEEVVARCHAIAAAIAVEQGADPEDVAEELREHDLERWLAGPERSLLRHHLGERRLDEDVLRQAEIDVSWRQESLWVLLWALGFVEELRPDEFCGDESAYERMAPDMDPAKTIQGIELRPRERLVAELDFHYCLHWHLRERELGRRRPLPEPLSEGFVRERRLPLEWLFAEDEWEEISLDT